MRSLDTAAVAVADKLEPLLNITNHNLLRCKSADTKTDRPYVRAQ